MNTRIRNRKSVALGAAVLAAATLLAGAGIGSPASAASRPHAAATMPDAAVAGCDVLLTAPVGHHCLLPWPNDAFTVHANTTTGRRLNISAKLDPKNNKGVHVATAPQNKGDGFSPGSVIMTYVAGLEHREVEDRDFHEHRPLAGRQLSRS